ncbi:MAG: 3-phosphoshikimate 1-carboxyvinyltransferase [Veillonella caviae]|nr:3-phosphoshikimate 1-carboxyvinyltransferase [Veillonella caviae]
MHTITKAIPSGTIAAIPAKAHAHRALIAATLSKETSTLLISLYSKDIDATINSLRGLGATIEKTATGVTVIPRNYSLGSASKVTLSEVETTEENTAEANPAKANTSVPSSSELLAESPTAYIDAHESGTTLRLLLPVGATLASEVIVKAAGRLPDRPLEPLKSQMEAHGVHFSKPKPPFTMSGRLQGGQFELAGHISSQFFSGLLLAAPQTGIETTVHSTTPLQSRDYVELTIKVMQDFGISVISTDDSFTVPAGATYVGQNKYPIEGDWSNSAIWLVAAALTGQALTITGLQPDSVQADRRIIDVIKSSGAQIHWETLQTTAQTAAQDKASEQVKSVNQSVNLTSNSTYITEHHLHCEGRATKPLSVDLEQMPDLLPVLAALACGIKGKSEFLHGARLRLKESDRLEAVTNLVNDLGGTAYCEGDNLYIEGTGSLQGGQGDCQNDHRLVMAGTLMALISEQSVTLKDSEAITKSYPLFFEHWNQLGGEAHEL